VTARLRPVAFLVQPQFMLDDGDTLTPLQVQPVTISAADWPNVVALVAVAVEELRQQIEEQPPAAATPVDNGRVTRSPKKVVDT